MKRRESIETLDPVFFEFGDQLANVQFESSLVISCFANNAVHGRKKVESRGVYKEVENNRSVVGKARSAVPVVDCTGTQPYYFFIGGRQASNDELLAALVSNLNSQHQWLLVVAFASLEKYLKDLYGTLGYLDRDLWHHSDFGGISPHEISSKNLAWHKERVLKIPDSNTAKVRQKLRRVPGVASYESNNCLGCDYDLIIGCIEVLRHIIVHSSGRIGWGQLLEKLEEHTGSSVSRMTLGPATTPSFIASFLEKNQSDSSTTVVLIDKRMPEPPYHGVLNGPFLSLLKHLGNYGALLYAQALRHFGHQPVWSR
jgi:hypothetical protein